MLYFSLYDYFGKPSANLDVSISINVRHIPPQYYYLLQKYSGSYFFELNSTYNRTDASGTISFPYFIPFKI